MCSCILRVLVFFLADSSFDWWIRAVSFNQESKSVSMKSVNTSCIECQLRRYPPHLTMVINYKTIFSGLSYMIHSSPKSPQCSSSATLPTNHKPEIPPSNNCTTLTTTFTWCSSSSISSTYLWRHEGLFHSSTGLIFYYVPPFHSILLHFFPRLLLYGLLSYESLNHSVLTSSQFFFFFF